MEIKSYTPDTSYHGPVVVFDLDDTLIRERDFCRSGFALIEQILSSRYDYDFSGLAAEMASALERREAYMPILHRRIAEAGLCIEQIDDIMDAYGGHTEGYSAISEAEALLENLSLRGIVCGLITDGRSVTQRAKIEGCGLGCFFRPDMIYISMERGADKSVPDNFAEIVRKYPEAKRFYYIADNERKDFLMPNLLGWTTIRAPYSEDNVHEDYHAEGLDAPLHRADTYNDIQGILADCCQAI